MEMEGHTIEDTGGVLEECATVFKQKDSIMEVGVINDTKRFLAAGGTPQVTNALASLLRQFIQVFVRGRIA